MESECLKVAIFLDGRPGHEKQTLGIVQALQSICEVQTQEIQITRESWWKRFLQSLRYLIRFTTCGAKNLNSVDLLIGTGSATHIPMLSCKRKFEIPVITCMTPAKYLLSDFDLCFIPQHDSPRHAPNIFITVGPPNISHSNGSHSDDRGLILLGGIDEKSHQWSDAEIGKQVKTLISMNADKKWTISSSPRTPVKTIEKIETLAKQYENATFFKFQDTPQGWVEQEYNRNKWVWVTADSLSMVYEALSAGCRVGILPVRWKNMKSKFELSERFLLENNVAVPFRETGSLSDDTMSKQPFNEAKRCAEEIINRWKRKNLR